VDMMKKLNRMLHIHEGLLEYTCEKAVAHSELLTSLDWKSMLAFVSNLAFANYRSKNYETLREMLSLNVNFDIFSKRDEMWLKLAAAYCVLDVYTKVPFENALKTNYIHRMIDTAFQANYENIMLIYQCVKLYKPEYIPLLPSVSLFEQVAHKLRIGSEYPLEGAIIGGVGGEQYVKSRVTNDLLQKLDHVIVYRKNGCPVAFGLQHENSHRMEALDVSPEYLTVVVLGLSGNHYAANKIQIKGSTQLLLKNLEQKGYIPVPINLKIWNALQDYEKIPYIMQEIKTRANFNSEVENVMTNS